MSNRKVKKGWAKRIFITDMQMLNAFYNEETDEVEYLPSSKTSQGVFPRFPVLIQANGDPWTLGNLYLFHKLKTIGKYTEQYNPKTWENWSGDLLHFLRWLEQNNVDPLFFHPLDKTNRPTYKYRDYLGRMMSFQTPKKERLSRNTAASRHGTVQNFYKGLVLSGVLESSVLDLAWERIQKLVKIISSDLTSGSKLIQVESTDQAIRRTKPKHDRSYIYDGEKLRPLKKDEQDIIDKYIQQSGITIRLIFTVARCTGARLQTICTLRGSTLANAVYHDGDNHYLVHVGGRNELTDTKGNKEETLVFSPELYNILTRYWNGNLATTRRIHSFYGNEPDNYLFLSKNNEPYYSSRQEIKDRRDPKYHRGVKAGAAVNRTVDNRRGQAIKTFIKDTLLPRIQNSEPNFRDFTFRFHDLRATFGMNTLEAYLEEAVRQEKPALWALEQTSELMNHGSITTTTLYLDFKHYKGSSYDVESQDKIETKLLQNVPDDVLNYDYD